MRPIQKTRSAAEEVQIDGRYRRPWFNHSVQVDTMFLLVKPVLHMIDMATHFSAATLLRSQSAKEIWPTIQSLWSLVYIGPPDHLTVDQGTSYVRKEMRSNLDTARVTLHEAAV